MSDAGQVDLRAEIAALTDAEIAAQLETIAGLDLFWHALANRLRYLVQEAAERLKSEAA